MSNSYVWKVVAVRGTWSEEDIKKAMVKVQNLSMSVYRVSIIYNVSRKTLERRRKVNDDTKRSIELASTFGRRM